MNLQVTKGFAKKAQKLPKTVQKELQTIIFTLQETEHISDIPGSKRLKSNKNDAGVYYRIRLGNYRIGIEFIGNTAKLVTIGDRKEIYRNFP